MSDKSAKFAIELEDQTSGAADAAANSLDNLKAKIDEDTKALREMQRAMRMLKGGTSTNVAAFRELRDKIDAQKATLAEAQAKYVELGGTFGKLPPPIRGAGGALNELAGAADGVPGPLGEVMQRLGGIRALTVGGVIAGAVVAIGIAFVALAAAAAAATAALLRYGIAQSNARRAELLRLEGLTTIRRWYGLAGGSAEGMQRAIDNVTDSVALGRGEIAGYAEQLHRMGLRGADLDDALEGMAITASVQGEAQARRFANMAAGAARAGRSVRGLADDVKSRLGGIAARQMLDFDVQMSKLRENIGNLFEGLRLEGFLQKLREFTSLFSENTVTGEALKRIVERLLQPLIGALEWLMPHAKRFFQGMVIGALHVEIGILRLRLWLKKTFGDSEILGGIDTMTLAMWAGVAVVGGLVGMFVMLAAIMGVVAIAAFAFSLPFLLAAAAIAGLVIVALNFVKWFRSLDWGELADSLIDGLVNGILRGGRAVREAIRGLADQAKGALTDALGIQSPSRVFAEFGLQIPRGLAQGIDAGAPIATGAVEDLAAVPEGGAAGRAGGGSSITINELHIHAKTDDPREHAQSFADALAEILEGVAVQVGAET